MADVILAYNNMLYYFPNLSDWFDTRTFAELATIILALMSMYVGYEYFWFYLRRKCRTECIKCVKKDANFIYNRDECPICFNGFTMPVIRAPCGHAYCINCLLSYFTTNYLEWKCACPLCRSMVNEFTIVENMGKQPTLDSQQIEKTKSLLTMMIKQQNKDLFLSKPWPVIKAVVYVAPFIIIIFLIRYVMNEEMYIESAENKISALTQTLF